MPDRKTSPVAGEIIIVNGRRAAVLGETLDDVLDMRTWTEVGNSQPSWTMDRLAQADAAADAFSEHVRRNPPKRIA